MLDGAFYSLNHDIEVGDAANLSFPRARRLAVAVVRHRDCALVRLTERKVEGVTKYCQIELDLNTHGVPSRRSFGIQFCERLALLVPENEGNLVKVLALRKSFPALMHQNSSSPGQPRDLCLYFEPPRAVSRTWTPEGFLRRIQWWLEMASRGTLHAADQPAEQLFFASQYELVLPWNIDALKQDTTQRLVMAKSEDRPNGGQTLFLQPLTGTGNSPDTALVEISLPPIVHGRVEGGIATLGHLADVLAARGVDLLQPLKELLKARVGSSGQTAQQGGKIALILLHIPIAREEGGVPTGVQRHAYLILGGLNELGVETGALFEQDGRYYDASGLLGSEPANTWRGRFVMPADVLYMNSVEAARKQSGIADSGPRALIIGAGSFGSALLSLWGRSGWGQWTVVDKDHIKPHNLSRHTAFTCHVGAPKTHAVQDVHRNAMNDASTLSTLIGDAENAHDEITQAAIRSHELVIDASAGIDYPRYASTLEVAGRHISAFLTPSGLSSVLMGESADRTVRLRTLEAQYYRALIRENWGATHLTGNNGTFWSGASCRDISLVIPYARIVSHAGIAADQIIRAAGSAEPCIRIWQGDEVNGGITAYTIQARAERAYPIGPLTVYVDDGLEESLRAMRETALPSETGGALLGYYDFNVKALVLVDALSAPPDSKSSPGAFERGVAGLAETVREAARRTANIVGYVGEWHSHPRGHAANPSRDDIKQLVYLALGMSEDGLPAVQLIVGENDLQIIAGSVQ